MSKRVLIVEDDALSLKLVREVLRAHDYETREVTQGADAIELAANEHFDLIIMDIGLPGMDGVEATRQIRLTHPAGKLPIVAVTAYAMPDDEERMRQAGCDVFLTKPLNLQDLVSIAGRLIPGDG